MQKPTTQNLVIENEVSAFSQFFRRLQMAFKLLFNPNAIVILGNKVEAFQNSPADVALICRHISSDLNKTNHEEQITLEAFRTLVLN